MEQTYPVHPLSCIKPHNQTQADLKSKRKMLNQSELKSLKDQWDIKNPQYIAYKAPQSEFLVKNPRHTSMSQIKIENLRYHRERNNLNEMPTDIKIANKDPQNGFVEIPTNTTKSQLEITRKEDMLKELNKTVNMQHISEYERLKLKEDSCLRCMPTEKGKTYDDIHRKMRNDNIAYHNQVFGHTSIGIHKKELPKFSENKKEYWVKKASESFVQPMPEEEAPSSEKEHVSIPKKADQLNKINECYKFNAENTKPAKNKKYKSIETRIAEMKMKRGLSIFDVIPDNRDSYNAYINRPMFSSFVPDLSFPEKYNYSVPKAKPKEKIKEEVQPLHKSLLGTLKKRALSTEKEKWVKTSGFS